MAGELRLRRGNTAQHISFTGASGEVTFNTDTKELHTHDGTTSGGFPLVRKDALAAPDSDVLVGGVEAGIIGRLNLSSVQELKTRAGLSIGMTVRTGMTTWRITTNPNNTLPIFGGLYAFPLNGAWLDDWGVDRTGVNPCDVSFQEANLIGRSIMLGQGRYRLNATINIEPGTTIKGLSEHTVIDARMSDVLFRFPLESGRNVKVFRDFHVFSSGSEMDESGCVFLFPGTPSGGVARFTSGYKFENIEVGGGGSFGCVWDVCDSFRLTIRDCGYTAVTQPLRLTGNVVQCVVDNLVGNNIDYVRGYKGHNAGVIMGWRTDYSDGMLRGPENVKIMNSAFVTHRRGALTAGLATRIENCDFDFIRDVGIEHGGGTGVEYVGGWIADSGHNFEFIGIRILKQGGVDDVHVKGITISAYGAFPTLHTAVQVGAGNMGNFAEPNGVVVEGMHIIGPDRAWDYGIQADRTIHVVLNNNYIKPLSIKVGGRAINATYSKQIQCTGNVCGDAVIHVEVPDVTGTATVTDNQATVTTANLAPPAANLEIARNRVGP